MKVTDYDYIKLYGMLTQVVLGVNSAPHPCVEQFLESDQKGVFDNWSEEEYENARQVMLSIQDEYSNQHEMIVAKADELKSLLEEMFLFAKTKTMSLERSDYEVATFAPMTKVS